MVNQDQAHTMDETRLRQLAETSVVDRNGKYSIVYNKPLPGIDIHRAYDNKDEAVKTLFDALKTQHGFKAA